MRFRIRLIYQVWMVSRQKITSKLAFLQVDFHDISGKKMHMGRPLLGSGNDIVGEIQCRHGPNSASRSDIHPVAHPNLKFEVRQVRAI